MQWPQHGAKLAAVFEVYLFQMESLSVRTMLHFWLPESYILRVLYSV